MELLFQEYEETMGWRMERELRYKVETEHVDCGMIWIEIV